MGVGITTSIVYAIGAIILSKEKEQHQGGVSQYHLAMLDKVGLSLFVVFEIFMILLLMLFKLITRDVMVATWICVVLLLGNFILPIVNAE